MKEQKTIKKSANYINARADSSLTIPFNQGKDTACTIHFVKNEMTLNEDESTRLFNGVVSLENEIFASITLSKSHALELADIIKKQIELFDQEQEKIKSGG